MADLQSKQSQLKDLNKLIKDRKEYLAQIEKDILTATENGAYAMRDLQTEIVGLQDEKARLMRKNFELAQQIREKNLTL